MTATSTLKADDPNLNGRTRAPVNTAAEPPVTADRVLTCLKSARHWANELPRFANRLQRRADGWSIASGLMSAITGLAIWAVLVEDKNIWATAATSALALASAGCALVPRIKNYGEMAGQARELAARYGTCLGQLTDAHAWMTDTTSADLTMIRQIVGAFESVKASKDSLRSLPPRSAENTVPQTRAQLPDCPLVLLARPSTALD